MTKGSWPLQQGRLFTARRLVQLVTFTGIFLLVLALFSVRKAQTRECQLRPALSQLSEADLAQYRGPAVERTDRFTLVLNSYHRRDLLQKSVQHYSQCPQIDAIRVTVLPDLVRR